MARVRTRAKRTVYLLIALAILFLLLELNRWLPGTWPGGGGGGFRAAGELGVDDPARTGRPAAPPTDAEIDPDTVEPPEAPPGEWPPRKGVLVEVRGPNGELAEGWRLGLGDGGPEGSRPNKDGTLRTRDKKVYSEGFRVRSAAGVLRHREGTNLPAARWSIHLPSAKLPGQVSRREIPVRVVDPSTGDPVAGAQVDYDVGGMDATATTDERGEAQVRVLGAAPVDVRVRKKGRVTTTARLSPREPGTAEIAQDEEIELTVQYAKHEDSVTGALLLGEGSPQLKGEVTVRGAGTGQRAVFRAARREIEGRWLATTVGSHSGTYTFRLPPAALQRPVEIPGGKVVKLHMRDVNGTTVERLKVFLDVQTYDGPQAEDEPREESEHGLADPNPQIVVAKGARARLRMEVAGAAPIVRTLTPIDGTDTLEFVAEHGIHVPVQVLGADGKPLSGARLVARTSMQGMRIEREAVSDARGRAQIGPFARGSIEVFAGAAGHAATAQVAAAAPAMATVTLRLAQGYPLRVVVEDPYGQALAGVDVEISPAGGGAPVVEMPAARAQVTDARGAITFQGLPHRSYDIALTRPGYGSQKLRKVRPGAVTYFATLVKRP